MSEIRFVHTADLHLDSPFTGLSTEAPPLIADTLRDATFGAFAAIIELCLEERVDALLVAGDIYDGADKSLAAQIRFYEGLGRLSASGIRSFVCHGNHDPLSGWEARITPPQGCHRFGPEISCAPFDPANPERGVVYGYSYPQQRVTDNIARRFQRTDGAAFAAGLLHCNVGGNAEHTAYAPCSIEDLIASQMDYWALGHVHTRQVLRDESPVIVYPGNPQGRHPVETGPRGVYLVEVDGPGHVRLDFREVDRVRWETLRVGINELEPHDEPRLMARIERSVGAALESAGRPLVYRLEITGRGPLHSDLRAGMSPDQLRWSVNHEWAGMSPFAWCERVIDRTAPAFDREGALSGDGFLADLLREFDGVTEAKDFELLRAALRPLLEHDRARRYLSADVSEKEFREILAGAETACLDELLEGSHG